MADSNIHMDDTKSAKAGTGRTRKRLRSAAGAAQNTLSEQAKQRKGQQNSPWLCLLSTQNNAFERRGEGGGRGGWGQGVMWHSRASLRRNTRRWSHHKAGGGGVAGVGVKGFAGDEAELRRQTPTSGPLLSPSWADELSQGCVCLPL